MIRALEFSSGFLRDAKRLGKRNPAVARRLNEVVAQLSQDAFDPSLRTHKLHGDLAGTLSCSAGYDLRIHFEIVVGKGGETVLLHAVGTHDEVY